MTFKELLSKYTDKQIMARVFKLYPDQRKNKQGYIEALEELRHKRAKKGDMQIDVHHVKDWFDGTEYVGVGGFDPEDVNTNYAIEFLKWSEWLGMEITPWSFENFSELDILGYCLWEMTWTGYSTKQVRGHYKRLVTTAKKAKAEIEAQQNADVA